MLISNDLARIISQEGNCLANIKIAVSKFDGLIKMRNGDEYIMANVFDYKGVFYNIYTTVPYMDNGEECTHLILNFSHILTDQQVFEMIKAMQLDNEIRCSLLN